MRALYQRQVCDAVGGWWSHGEPFELEFTAEYEGGDEPEIDFTPETKIRMYMARLSEDEIRGCVEAAVDAFDASEQEECRLSNVRQRNATEAA